MDQHIKNPFSFGSIVKNEKFCNRNEELYQLKKHIKDSYSVWLFSPRRYGKSSLVHKMLEDESITGIYFDFYNVRSVDDFCKKYADTIAKQLFSWDQEISTIVKKIGSYFSNLKSSVSFDEFGHPSFRIEKLDITDQKDVETILNVPNEIAKNSKKPICIAFDEFQEINRIDPFLINWMRSAFQNHEKISYVFLGSQQSLMEDIFSSDYSPFYEFAEKMNLRAIKAKEWEVFIKQKFEENDLLIKQKQIDTILEKSGGHPHFTQYFSSAVFDLIREGLDQNREDFTEIWMGRILQSQSLFFQDIYDQLTNIQRQVLTTLAVIKPKDELFSSASRMKYQLPTSSSILRAIQAMSKRNIIIKADTRYSIINPIFKEWLIRLSLK